MVKLKYKRVLIKISGESLSGEKKYGINTKRLIEIARKIKEVKETKAEIAIVIGGGNIFRGRDISNKNIDRATADYMGMLATIINALALQDALEKIGENVRVLSAINAPQVAEPYIRRRAIRHLEKGRIVICAAGTGNPYFSTDTGAALRALEIDCDVLIKATKVDGVYNKDPKKYNDAKKYRKLSYLDILNNNLGVMDSTATSLCMDNNLPIIVLNLLEKDSIKKALLGKNIGTIITK